MGSLVQSSGLKLLLKSLLKFVLERCVKPRVYRVFSEYYPLPNITSGDEDWILRKLRVLVS